MSTTPPKGVREASQRSADLDHADQKDIAKQRAEFEAADKKTINDLPDDHPFKKREEIMAQIEAANNSNQGYTIEDGQEGANVVATPKADATATTEADQLAAATKVEKDTLDVSKQIAAQTEDGPILDADTLAKAYVMVKVDGVETRVPASKVLGQYQKGAAADVRLAAASKAVKEAEEKAAKLLADAQAVPAKPLTEPPVKVRDVQAANAKFKEASEALFSGDSDKAAELFSEATALAVSPQPDGRAEPSTINSDDLVTNVAQRVKQQLSTEGALTQLFKDYPEIKAKRAFSIIADEYIGAFTANGDDMPTAIAKAGDALAEEYGWSKAGDQKPTPVDKGRLLLNGGPTTQSEKLNAKKELDVVTSGNARATSLDTPEPSVADTIAEMMKARPGAPRAS